MADKRKIDKTAEHRAFHKQQLERAKLRAAGEIFLTKMIKTRPSVIGLDASRLKSLRKSKKN